MQNLITVITFHNLSDSYIPQSILESYEIPCSIVDGIMGQLYVAGAFGGVKLQVLDSDYERAKKVLEEAGYSPDI